MLETAIESKNVNFVSHDFSQGKILLIHIEQQILEQYVIIIFFFSVN